MTQYSSSGFLVLPVDVYLLHHHLCVHNGLKPCLFDGQHHCGCLACHAVLLHTKHGVVFTQMRMQGERASVDSKVQQQ